MINEALRNLDFYKETEAVDYLEKAIELLQKEVNFSTDQPTSNTYVSWIETFTKPAGVNRYSELKKFFNEKVLVKRGPFKVKLSSIRINVFRKSDFTEIVIDGEIIE